MRTKILATSPTRKYVVLYVKSRYMNHSVDMETHKDLLQSET